MVKGAREAVTCEAVCRSGHEESTVGERRAETGGEPAVGERKCPGQAVVEGQVVLGPITHGHPGISVVVLPFGAAHEAIVAAVAVLFVAGIPRLAGHADVLLGRGQTMGGDQLSVARRVDGRRISRSVPGQAIPTVHHAQVVVVRMVLHHQHDDVSYLGKTVLADGEIGARRREAGPLAFRGRSAAQGRVKALNHVCCVQDHRGEFV